MKVRTTSGGTATEYAAPLALGFVVLSPLLALHEAGALAEDGGWCNFGRAVLALPLAGLGTRASLGLWIVLAAALAGSLVWIARSDLALVPRLEQCRWMNWLSAILLAWLVIGSWLLALQTRHYSATMP